LGPSGCGKTTTMRLIAGLAQPTAGTVHLGSRDVTHLPPQERYVAMVSQDYALYAHMTGFANIAYPRRVRKVTRAGSAAPVEEVALNRCRANLCERRPRQLSGGQKQRTAVGRAVVPRAACCLSAQPLSTLDDRLRVEAQALLKRLQQDTGVTTIFVTHDQ